MAESRSPIGHIRNAWNPTATDEVEPTRCCARCRTPYNCGNTICHCHPNDEIGKNDV